MTAPTPAAPSPAQAAFRDGDEMPAFPPPCPKCGAARRWDHPRGGGLDAVCDACGRRGAFDNLKVRVKG